jgi:hypothetical protein
MSGVEIIERHCMHIRIFIRSIDRLTYSAVNVVSISRPCLDVWEKEK